MKRKLSPVTTALILIAVLGAVLFAYTKGLLGEKEAEEGGPMGGGAPGPSEMPPVGLASVQVSTFAGYLRPGFLDAKGWDAKFNGPAGIAAALDGSLYVSDSRNHRIRRIAPDGTVTTVAGSGPTDCIPGSFADGPAEQARLFNPAGIAVGNDGTVYFADAGSHRIRAIRDGVVSTVAGSATPTDELGIEQGGYRDGPAQTAQFRFPAAIALLPTGDILVADLGNKVIRRVAAGGAVTTEPPGAELREPTDILVSSTLPARFTVADPAAGAVYQSAIGSGPVARGLQGRAPGRPTGLCEMPGGALAVIDAEWHAIFGVDASGTCVLLAGVLPKEPTAGFRDGTGEEAKFGGPCAVAGVGNTLYVTDFGNNCIRAVTVPPNWASPPSPEPERPGRRWRQRREGGRSAD